MFYSVCRATEEMFPEGTVDELEEGEDFSGARGWGGEGAVEEEREETETEGKTEG